MTQDRERDWPTGTPVFEERDCRVYMVEPGAWPDRVLIAGPLMREGWPDVFAFSSFRHLRISAENGQAVYRLVWRNRGTDTFAGELSYAALEPPG